MTAIVGTAVGETPLSAYDPTKVITGTAWSSHACNSAYCDNINLQEPTAIGYINVFKSLNAAVPGATGQASTGTARYSYSHGVAIFQRQDYAQNSSNLTYVTSASFGLTAGLSYSSTSQSFVMSWVTNATGGTTSTNTTSNAANWSSWVTGPKMFRIPLNRTLGPGEYVFAHSHSSTTGTTQSNVTLMSVSNAHVVNQQTFAFGGLGTTGTYAFSVAGGMGQGIVSGVTTDAAMPVTAISNSVLNPWIMNFSVS